MGPTDPDGEFGKGRDVAVRVVTDSASSLSERELADRSLEAVDLHVFIDGRRLSAEELSDPGFYERLSGLSEPPTTSQPSPEEFADVFRTAVMRSEDVLAVLISEGMSGTVRSAELAATTVRAEYPEARIEVLDSRSNSLEEGFAVLSASDVASDGGTIEACRAAAEATMERTRFLFTPHSLEHLRRGGRISGASELVSVALKIAPILTARDGETGIAGVSRGSRSARAKVAALMRSDIERCGLRRVVVQYVDDEGEAKRFAEETVEPIVDRKVPLTPIHPVVGLHVGPAVGVVYETEAPLR